MTLTDMLKELESIIKVHPEAGDAAVWVSTYDDQGDLQFPVSYISYDSKHKPHRINLQD